MSEQEPASLQERLAEADEDEYYAAHPDSRVAGAERLADSAEALLREALERLERVLSHPASSAHWDTGPNGGEIAGAMVQARAALQASAPSPADIHDLPGHKAHECRICGQWTEKAAAEGSEPLDVAAAWKAGFWQGRQDDEWRMQDDEIEAAAAAYASQKTDG